MRELNKLNFWLDTNFDSMHLKETASRKIRPNMAKMLSAHRAIEEFKQSHPIEIVRWAVIGNDSLAYQDLRPDPSQGTYDSKTKASNEWYVVNGGWIGIRDEGSDTIHSLATNTDIAFVEIPVDDSFDVQRAYDAIYKMTSIPDFVDSVINNIDSQGNAPR